MTKDEAIQTIRSLAGVEAVNEGWTHKGHTLTVFTRVSGTAEPDAFNQLGTAVGKIVDESALVDFNAIFLTSVIK